MITKFWKPYVCVTALLVSAGAFAQGGESSFGGSGCASQFLGVAQRAAAKLRMICQSDRNASACTLQVPLFSAIATATVVADDQVLGPDGYERDAINNGADKITVSRKRWNAARNHSDAAESWIRTAIHEYLGIAQIEASDTYTRSDSVVTLLKENGFDLERLAGSMTADFPARAKGFSVENVYVNGDGSVSLILPRILYRGTYERIYSSQWTTDALMYAKAICGAFALGAPTSLFMYEDEVSTNDEGFAVQIDDQAMIRNVWEAKNHRLFRSITCRPN